MKAIKVLAPITLALMVAGCQTAPRGAVNVTQSAFGQVNPQVPADWERRNVRGGEIIFVCPVQRCAEPGLIGYSAMYSNANIEVVTRRKIFSAGLLREAGKSLSHATGGKFQVISVRDVTNASSAGFEKISSMATATGTFYAASRLTMIGHEARSVTGVSTSLAKAKRNLAIGLAGIR